MKIIINADDFGMSKNINEAIIESFNKKLITSGTLMANMSGFEDTCKKIIQKICMVK